LKYSQTRPMMDNSGRKTTYCITEKLRVCMK
jgi:hypothetical protein